MVRGHLEQVAEEACKWSLNLVSNFRRPIIPYPTPPNCSHINGGDGELVFAEGESLS